MINCHVNPVFYGMSKLHMELISVMFRCHNFVGCLILLFLYDLPVQMYGGLPPFPASWETKERRRLCSSRTWWSVEILHHICLPFYRQNESWLNASYGLGFHLMTSPGKTYLLLVSLLIYLFVGLVLRLLLITSRNVFFFHVYAIHSNCRVLSR